MIIRLRNIDISADCSSDIYISERIDGVGSTARIEYTEERKFTPNAQAGDPITISYPNGEQLFSGIVSDIDRGLNARDNSSTIVALDDSYRLKWVEVNKIFEDTNTRAIIEEVLQPLGMQTNCPEQDIRRLSFLRTNARDVVYKIARIINHSWYVRDGTLWFSSPNGQIHERFFIDSNDILQFHNIEQDSLVESVQDSPPYNRVSVKGQLGADDETTTASVTVGTNTTDFYLDTDVTFRTIESITVNSQSLSVGNYGLDNNDTTKDILWSQSGKFIRPGLRLSTTLTRPLNQNDVFTIVGYPEVTVEGDTDLPEKPIETSEVSRREITPDTTFPTDNILSSDLSRFGRFGYFSADSEVHDVGLAIDEFRGTPVVPESPNIHFVKVSNPDFPTFQKTTDIATRHGTVSSSTSAAPVIFRAGPYIISMSSGNTIRWRNLDDASDTETILGALRRNGRFTDAIYDDDRSILLVIDHLNSPRFVDKYYVDIRAKTITYLGEVFMQLNLAFPDYTSAAFKNGLLYVINKLGPNGFRIESYDLVRETSMEAFRFDTENRAVSNDISFIATDYGFAMLDKQSRIVHAVDNLGNYVPENNFTIPSSVTPIKLASRGNDLYFSKQGSSDLEHYRYVLDFVGSRYRTHITNNIRDPMYVQGSDTRVGSAAALGMFVQDGSIYMLSSRTVGTTTTYSLVKRSSTSFAQQETFTNLRPITAGNERYTISALAPFETATETGFWWVRQIAFNSPTISVQKYVFDSSGAPQAGFSTNLAFANTRVLGAAFRNGILHITGRANTGTVARRIEFNTVANSVGPPITINITGNRINGLTTIGNRFYTMHASTQNQFVVFDENFNVVDSHRVDEPVAANGGYVSSDGEFLYYVNTAVVNIPGGQYTQHIRKYLYNEPFPNAVRIPATIDSVTNVTTKIKDYRNFDPIYEFRLNYTQRGETASFLVDGVRYSFEAEVRTMRKYRIGFLEGQTLSSQNSAVIISTGERIVSASIDTDNNHVYILKSNGNNDNKAKIERYSFNRSTGRMGSRNQEIVLDETLLQGGTNLVGIEYYDGNLYVLSDTVASLQVWQVQLSSNNRLRLFQNIYNIVGSGFVYDVTKTSFGFAVLVERGGIYTYNNSFFPLEELEGTLEKDNVYGSWINSASVDVPRTICADDFRYAVKPFSQQQLFVSFYGLPQTPYLTADTANYPIIDNIFNPDTDVYPTSVVINHNIFRIRRQSSLILGIRRINVTNSADTESFSVSIPQGITSVIAGDYDEESDMVYLLVTRQATGLELMTFDTDISINRLTHSQSVNINDPPSAITIRDVVHKDGTTYFLAGQSGSPTRMNIVYSLSGTTLTEEGSLNPTSNSTEIIDEFEATDFGFMGLQRYVDGTQESPRIYSYRDDFTRTSNNSFLVNIGLLPLRDTDFSGIQTEDVVNFTEANGFIYVFYEGVGSYDVIAYRGFLDNKIFYEIEGTKPILPEGQYLIMVSTELDNSIDYSVGAKSVADLSPELAATIDLSQDGEAAYPNILPEHITDIVYMNESVNRTIQNQTNTFTYQYVPMYVSARDKLARPLTFFTFAPVSSVEAARQVAERIAIDIDRDAKTITFDMNNNDETTGAPVYLGVREQFRLGNVINVRNDRGAVPAENFFVTGRTITIRGAVERMTVRMENIITDKFDDIDADLLQDQGNE